MANLLLFLSDRCNMVCDYCFLRLNQGKAVVLPEDAGRMAIDAHLRDTQEGEASLTFLGGEPLLHFGLLKALAAHARARASWIRLRVVTNGTLATRQRLAELETLGVSVTISLDGAAATHDAHRRWIDGAPALRRSLRALEGADLGRLQANMVVREDTAGALLSNIEYLRGLGFGRISFHPDVHGRWSAAGIKSLEAAVRGVARYRRALKAPLEFPHLSAYARARRGARCPDDEDAVLGADARYYPSDGLFVRPYAELADWSLGDARQGLDRRRRDSVLKKAGAAIHRALAGAAHFNCPRETHFMALASARDPAAAVRGFAAADAAFGAALEGVREAAAGAAVERGDLAGAYRLLSAGDGGGPGPDFRVPERDPRQDLQYGAQSASMGAGPAYLSARRRLARLRRDQPRCAAAWFLGGVVETFLGEPRRARLLLDRALALEPGLSWARAWRGVAYGFESRRSKSQALLGRALADLDAAAPGPAGAFVLPWRAEIRHDLEDMTGALGDLEDILRREPGNLWARVERGEILCESRRVEDAMREFDLLVAENPRAAWAYALRGRTLATSGREADSLQDLERAVALDPSSAAYRAWLAEAHRKAGRYGEALASLDEALARDPGFVLAWIWRGRIFLALGRLEEALSDLDRAARMDPRYRLAFAWRGEARFKLGRYAAAAADFARIAPMDPSRTWNPTVAEGEPITPAAREQAYLRAAELAARLRPRSALLDRNLSRSGHEAAAGGAN